MANKTDAYEVLATHRIALKTCRRRNGNADQYYSIQFTYPKGKKRQFTELTAEEVREKVYSFFGSSSITFAELYERWRSDPDLNDDQKREARAAKYGPGKFIDYLGAKLAVDVTGEDILDAGKRFIASGCKTHSANLQIRNIRHMYDYGIKKGLITNNPAVGITVFRRQELEYERKYLTDRQICEFLNDCRRDGRYVFAVFLICGIAPEQFVPLKWKNIDFSSRRINICKKTAGRKSPDTTELERMEKRSVEEPKMAFDYLELELARQSRELRIDRGELVRSDKHIMTN